MPYLFLHNIPASRAITNIATANTAIPTITPMSSEPSGLSPFSWFVSGGEVDGFVILVVVNIIVVGFLVVPVVGFVGFVVVVVVVVVVGVVVVVVGVVVGGVVVGGGVVGIDPGKR